MKTILFGSNEVRLQGSPWTAKIYRDAFDESMNFDLERGLYYSESGDVVFADADILLRVAWSMAKTADDAIPELEAWSTKVFSDDEEDFAYYTLTNILGKGAWGAAVISVIDAELFRTPQTKRAT